MEQARRASGTSNLPDEIRVGFSGEQAPFSQVPNIVGEPRFRTLCNLPPNGEVLKVGYDVLSSYGLLRTQRPMDHGLIADWDTMEYVWSEIYNTELRQESSQLPLLFLRKEGSSKRETELIQEIFFEKFQAPLLGILNQGTNKLISTLISQGQVLGQSLGVSSGCFVTISTCITIVNIYEGHHLKEFDKRYDFGGNEVTEMFGRILSARYGPSFLKGNGLDFEVENMKKEICFVAEDFAEQLYEGQHSNDGEIFQLPDRKKILVQQERFIAPEIYFQPALFGARDMHQNLTDMILSSITSCPLDTWDSLFAGIFVAGGEALTPGLIPRLEHELQCQVTCPVGVKFVEDPRNATWKAGSLVASLPDFADSALSKQSYDEGENLLL